MRRPATTSRHTTIIAARPRIFQIFGPLGCCLGRVAFSFVFAPDSGSFSHLKNHPLFYNCLLEYAQASLYRKTMKGMLRTCKLSGKPGKISTRFLPASAVRFFICAAGKATVFFAAQLALLHRMAVPRQKHGACRRIGSMTKYSPSSSTKAVLFSSATASPPARRKKASKP